MTNIGDDISGQAPSLLPTGRPGRGNGPVSILRDLDPRSARLGTTPSFPIRTVLLVAAPLALGAALLIGYFYFAATQAPDSRSHAITAADLPATDVSRQMTVPASQAVAAASMGAATSHLGHQGAAIILAHPDASGSGKALPNSTPVDTLAKDEAGQPHASKSTRQDEAAGKSKIAVASKHDPQNTVDKASRVSHAKIAGTRRAKPQAGENKVIEHEIDVVTAIVKGAQN